jgi:tetratricopeptide (TPR) repeat protein
MFARLFTIVFLAALPALASPEAADRLAGEALEAFTTGDFDKAADLLTKAIAEDGGRPEFYTNRGSCYDNLGKTADALRDFDISFQKTVERTHDPKDKGLAEIVYNRGATLARAGRFREALAEFEKALTFDEAFPDARMDLAWILATNPSDEIRKPAKALEYALEEIRRNGPHSPGVVDTLAAAYAATGKFDEAVTKEKEAIEQASNILQRKQYNERLRLYQGCKPFIEQPAPASH